MKSDKGPLHSRIQSVGEEIANSVSHGIGVILAMAAVPVLVVSAVENGGVAEIVGASIFAGTMVVLYLISTIYHVLPHNRAKQLFRVLDHMAIYLLIAGTYTPFTLGVLRGTWGWTLFGLIWGLAVFGVLLKTVSRVRYHAATTLLYLVMGWLCLIAAGEMLRNIPSAGIYWLLAGGLAYTVGVPFYALDERIRYSHFVWHLFVVAGTTCHFVAVLQYAA